MPDWKGDYRLAFPHDYISAADLKGKDVPLTISKVELSEVRVISGKDNGNGKKEETKQKKLCLHFHELRGRKKGEPRMLLLNKTNATTIGQLYGKEAGNWVDRGVILYPTTCLAFGKREDCIRIREEAPPPKRNQQPPPDESDLDRAAAKDEE